MKKILSISVFAFLVFISTVHSQILKKDVLIGGTFGFTTGSGSNSYSTSNANINPRIGYAITNNSVLNANFGYAYSRNKSDVAASQFTSNTFNFGLSWRRFIPIKEKFGMFTSLYGSFGKGSSKQENENPHTIVKSTSSNFNAGLSPGLYYIPIPWLVVSVDAGGFGYTYSKNKTEGNPTGHYSSFGINFLNSFTFGVDFILHKKKA